MLKGPGADGWKTVLSQVKAQRNARKNGENLQTDNVKDSWEGNSNGLVTDERESGSQTI